MSAPSTISYLRLLPHNWSASYNTISMQDREAAIRLCPEFHFNRKKIGSFHAEIRVGDATSSPYLHLGSNIHAGLIGLENNAKIKHYVDATKVGKNTRNTWMSTAKCVPNGQQFDLKSMKKASQMVPNTAHGGPKAPHGHPGVPKSAPGMPKSVPKVLQKLSREAKMIPKTRKKSDEKSMLKNTSDFLLFWIDFPSVLDGKIHSKLNKFMNAQICENRYFCKVKQLFFRSEVFQKAPILSFEAHARNFKREVKKHRFLPILGGF